ncbi:extracellular matrix organizing protein FRAS1-like [Amphibalanus amphitrite]|uniref:extracellular matrix organizing protein FRAS1-like n=1 Tax=Amphibalanus amphitrite TaxID=1232801 RepID=UPI001C927E5C|nr:extracellular matrix organizing protein FRAS1-like [Amphibalanus amphitrite]
MSISVAISLLLAVVLPETVLSTPCYSSSLQQWFADGAKWTEPPCTGMTCSGGFSRGQFCPTGSFTPGSGCVREPGTPGADFPACCEKIKCPEPGQCYSTALDRTFNDGETWTESPCTKRECRMGTTHIQFCPTYSMGPGCVKTPGIPGADYPQCCDQVKCPEPDQCYSEGLQKTFNSGETWTEPPCTLYRCDSGVSRGQLCPWQFPQPGCTAVNGTAGAPYPQCCDRVQCPVSVP